jgi:hypothetical protein
MAGSKEGRSSDVWWLRPIREEEELLHMAHKLHPPPLQLDVRGGEEEEVRSELSMTNPQQWRTATRC